MAAIIESGHRDLNTPRDGAKMRRYQAARLHVPYEAFGGSGHAAVALWCAALDRSSTVSPRRAITVCGLTSV
jgi:hypothetical protein